MVTFIDELVEHVLASTHNLASIQLIFPSKRAGTLFKKKISQRLDGISTFLPRVRSIEELTVEMSGLATVPQTHLQFEMYRAYLKTNQKDPDSFVEFLAWAPGVLGDFNEIDRYLISTVSFFDYLGAIKDLEHWSADPDPTPMVRQYIKFWKEIELFYETFNTLLKKQGLGYQGMQYRQAATAAQTYTLASQDHFIFAGFNALNNAEQFIIECFLENNKAEIIWDIDSHFLSDASYNAGRFIKSYLNEWKHFEQNTIHKGSDYYSHRKDIHSIAIAGNIGQAKYIGQLINTFSQEELENTAIVLGDEALLLPLLTSLPANVKNINITMGLPLDQVPDASFFDAWLTLHEQVRKDAFICKDLLSFLTQGHSERLLGADTALIRKKIEQENLIYIKPQTLIATCKNSTKAAHALFNLWNDNATTAIKAILEVIKRLKNQLIPSKNWLQLEYLFSFQEIFSQLEGLSRDYHYLENLKSLHYFYRELLSKETLDFRGDPYAGLQIMGVLESRVLDFKNVIVTGLNEGTLPSGKSQGSFIPFDLKMEYKLPTYREKDAIYAYHFFRLMQRAEHIYLLYNNESSGINSAEKSRFLLQLEIERQPDHTFTEISANAPVSITTKTIKTIQKTPAMIEKLKAQAAYGFSPSALTTYIRNPIDFYYRYVLGIPELDSIEDVVAHNTLGTIVHEALEQLYLPYLHQQLTSEILKAMKASIPQAVENQFERLYNLNNVKTGKNLIIYNVALQFVENLINKEKDLLKAGNTLTVMSCEQKFTAPLQQEPFAINLRGTVDRMDIINETHRIIDYKTGNVTATELKLNDWELLITDYKKHSKAFQVLCYSLMLYKTDGLPENLEAGIISFKNLNSGFLRFQENKNTEINEVLMKKFEAFVLQLIYEILDIKSPFVEKEII
jgi:hypothetical protein